MGLINSITGGIVRIAGNAAAAIVGINTLNDLWNWPNNSSNGYATASADWFADNSAGLSKRANDILTYKTYPYNTGALHYTNNLSRTVDSLNRGFAAYKHYFQTFGESENPTFHKFAKHPIVEWNIQPNGRTIAGIHYELNSNNMPHIRVQFTHAHNFANGDQIEFFGFAPDSTGRDDKVFNTLQPYVTVIDGFNVALHPDSGRTQNLQLVNQGFTSQGDIFFTVLNDGSYNGALLSFDGFDETFTTGDTLQIADPFVNMGAGTLASAASGTLIYLEEYGHNSYKLFSDSGRTTPFTMTSVNMSTAIPFDIPSSGVTKNIQNLSLSDSSFATLRGQIESQNMSPNSASEDTTNIFRGFCRVQITQGSGVSRTIPSSIDDSVFFGYKYDKSAQTITLLNDPTGAFGYRDTNILTASFATGNIQGNIKIIDFWTYTNESPGLFTSSNPYPGELIPTDGTNVGGLLWSGSQNDTGLASVSPLSHPLASEATTLYSGTKSTNDDNNNFDKLIYQLFSTTVRSPGFRKYQYQDTNNATQKGAVYDFTKFWRPGQTSHFTPTYLTTPTGTPVLSTQGYLTNNNNLDTFPQRGLFTLAGLGLTSSTDTNNNAILSGSPAKPSTHVIEKVGLFEINPKADEYVAPTAYAPDVFDTDDEWDTDAFTQAKQSNPWPKSPVPRNINFTTNQPTSVTRSQNGTKYVRSSGVVKHQMEVEYAPMLQEDFRNFHAYVQSARGQATPFYFDIRNYTNYAGTTGLHIFGQNTTGSTSNTRGFTNENFVRTTVDQSLNRAPEIGDKLITLEGFVSNRADVFIKGEQVIFNMAGYADGNLVTIVNDNIDSNRYGEARIRIPYGVRSGAAGSGQQLYFDPTHIIVTLAEDAFEFELGADGLYRITVRFDFDEFK